MWKEWKGGRRMKTEERRQSSGRDQRRGWFTRTSASFTLNETNKPVYCFHSRITKVIRDLPCGDRGINISAGEFLRHVRCTKTGKRGRWNLNWTWYTSLAVCNLSFFFLNLGSIDLCCSGTTMFLFFFPFEDLDRRYKIQGARLWRTSLSLYSWDNEEGGEKRKKWNWLVSSAIKPVSRRESIFCIVGFLERIQWRAKFRASDRIDKKDRLKSTCMFFILLRPFFMSILSDFEV